MSNCYWCVASLSPPFSISSMRRDWRSAQSFLWNSSKLTFSFKRIIIFMWFNGKKGTVYSKNVFVSESAICSEQYHTLQPILFQLKPNISQFVDAEANKSPPKSLQPNNKQWPNHQCNSINDNKHHQMKMSRICGSFERNYAPLSWFHTR